MVGCRQEGAALVDKNSLCQKVGVGKSSKWYPKKATILAARGLVLLVLPLHHIMPTRKDRYYEVDVDDGNNNSAGDPPDVQYRDEEDDAPGDTNDEEGLLHTHYPSPSPATPMTRQIIPSFLVGFVLGVVVMAAYLGYAGRPGLLNQAVTVEEEDVNAVSYNFLRTTKGTETLRLLLRDLLQSKTTQTENTESSDYQQYTGPRRALKHISVLIDSDAQIASSCHPLIHNLGRAAYEYFGSLDAAFDGMIGTDDATLVRLCNAAYLHGVIEFHLRGIEISDLASEARVIEDKICTKLNNVNMGRWECHHGIGHGLVQRHRLEAEKYAVTQGIVSCKDSNIKSAGPSECENGVWMDHFAVSGNVLAMEMRMMALDIVLRELNDAVDTKERGSFVTPPLPPTLQICTELASQFAVSDCLVYSPTEYLLVNPRDYIGALEYCSHPTANLGSRKSICIAGVGMQCAKENMNDFGVVESVCQTLNDMELERSCFSQAISYYKTSTGGMSPNIGGACDNVSRYKDMCH